MVRSEGREDLDGAPPLLYISETQPIIVGMVEGVPTSKSEDLDENQVFSSLTSLSLHLLKYEEK